MPEREAFPDRLSRDEELQSEDLEKLFLTVSSLYHGFPQLSEKPLQIRFETQGDRPLSLKLDLGEHSFGEGEYESALALLTYAGSEAGDKPSSVMSLADLYYHRYRPGRPRFHRTDSGGNANLPCIYVSPHGGQATASLARLWDDIALSDDEQYVIQALQIIDPRISAASMVGEEYRRLRTAIVRADHVPRPIPLRSYGDGMNRLFGIVLSLVNAGKGLLLIDEFENGLHHRVQFDVWRIIFKLVRNLDIQVFATSHSWDAIEAFQKAAADSPEDGALIRLTRREGDIIPTLFTEKELVVATRNRIEVR